MTPPPQAHISRAVEPAECHFPVGLHLVSKVLCELRRVQQGNPSWIVGQTPPAMRRADRASWCHLPRIMLALGRLEYSTETRPAGLHSLFSGTSVQMIDAIYRYQKVGV